MKMIFSNGYIKKLLPKAAAVLAAFTLCGTVMPAYIAPDAAAVDVYQFSENGFYYTINAVSGVIEACVVGYKAPTGVAGAVSIPETLGTYTVTSIGVDAFAEQATMTSVSVPKTVRTIGTGAFENCSGLKTVNISAGLTDIAERSFKGCAELTSLNLPATVVSVGTSAFEDCSSLKNITLSSGLKTIGNYAFRRCRAIEAVNLPNSVTSLGEGAYEECTGLKTLNLSPGITELKDFTFYRCSLLYPLNLTENIVSIGRYTFSECTALSSVTIPKSVQTIGASAFENCQYLAVAIIPNTTQYIYPSAFRNDPVAIYGYTGTYAEQFARENGLSFTSYGKVYNLTFSADIYYASIDNISIKTPNGTLVPPTTVQNDEALTITATAPDGYVVDHITINGEGFTNGSVYRVHDSDVSIFVSYRLRETTTAATTPDRTGTAAPSPVTTADPDVTNTPPRDDEPEQTDSPSIPPETTTTIKDTTGESSGSDNDYVKVDSDLEGVGGNNVRIMTQRSNFVGPATVRLTNTPEASEAAENAAEAVAGNGTMYYYAFDISLYNSKGKEDQGVMSGGSIIFQIPVPDTFSRISDRIKVYHISDETPELIPSSIITDNAGVRRVQFEADSFSPYMFVAETDDETVNIVEGDGGDPDDGEEPGSVITVIDETGKTPEATVSSSDTTKPVSVPVAGNTKTGGDNKGNPTKFNPGTGALLLIGIPSVTLGCAFLVRSRKVKRTRTKNDIK